MHEHSVKKTALTFGIFAALIHLVWSALVALGLAQELLNWRLGMHFVNLPITVTQFNPINALLLIVLAFIGGAVIGAVLATIWNNTPE